MLSRHNRCSSNPVPERKRSHTYAGVPIVQENPSGCQRQDESTHHPGHVVAQSSIGGRKHQVSSRRRLPSASTSLRQHFVAIRGILFPESICPKTDGCTN